MTVFYNDAAHAEADGVFNGNPSSDQILKAITLKLQMKSRAKPVQDSVVVVQGQPNTRVTFTAIPVGPSDWEVTSVVGA